MGRRQTDIERQLDIALLCDVSRETERLGDMGEINVMMIIEGPPPPPNIDI